MKRILLGFALATVIVSAASAQVAAGYRPAFADPRIRTLYYDANRVVRLDAYAGYQMMIQFAPDERVENVAIGDGSGWQVTPNKDASLIFLKPLESAAHTNMTVVTDQRSYLFELEAHPGGMAQESQVVYLLRFSYPPPAAVARVTEPAQPAVPEKRNTAYTYTGSRDLLPSVVFDDGHFTYFKWPPDTTTPAVFTVGPDGQESLINYTWRDGFEAVEQVAPKFMLRNGKQVTTVINEGWRAPLRGPDAPRPHDAITAREAARDGVRP